MESEMKKTLLHALLVAASLCVATSSFAQLYPERPIRLVVPYPPGGPLDIAARTLADSVRSSLGTVIVENKSGAGGNIGADSVAKAPPDGYTLLIGAVATHAINPTLYPKMPYDAQRDFAPITLIADVPNVLVVNTDYASKNKIDSLARLIAHMKSHPGKVLFGSGGNGSAGHLAGELFKMKTGTFALHIPYRGASPAQLALLGGEVHFMFDNLASAAPRIRDGKVKALGVTTLKRAAAFPELPTLSESGVAELRDFDVSTWFGVFAPANTPKPILGKLHAQLVAGLKSKAFIDVMNQLAAEPAPNSPDEFAGLIAREAKKYEAIIKYSNAKVD
jgi:tripartite-type tricarboxylate transporter receptor subunit TctC